MTCGSCGHENPAGAKFCAECGSALLLACPSCGTPHRPGDRFCVECGSALGTAQPKVKAPEAPVAERRLVSVVFADLVGFTPLSESRDPEEVRELLSRYFDTCRRLVELYGGTVEKFIGDAVMAVWGTPVAQEDDAERAVRAALDLVAAVSALGDEVGAPELRARAGVLTGEAAVNLGAVGQGMVAGDLVNSAARIQAAAEPGSVLVGEATRRASEQAIAFDDTGEHMLKGKAEPMRLWRALRVTAARGGAMRSEGLEAPFVGRERELRLVKELYHASAEQSKAQLVQVVGIAGIGKSRLTWEFEKYIDGLAENVWWHRGRCLAYGEGVAYWALAEMVRMRARILEGEEQRGAREKLAACLSEHVPEPDERTWIEPRLANLLGLEDRADTDRQDLFAAWRLFFERLTDQGPLVMVFEDLQWADLALLAFIEYLLEWSASQPLYVVALSRPDLAGEQSEFGRSVRNAATLSLEPLSDTDMARLLEGYVPGLPDDLKAQVLGRAQGVPLYAVETVRMLLDRNLLVQDGPIYRPTGEIGSLDVPETLHALAAARLDGLPLEERRLVQDACVLGKTFTKQALAAVAGRSETDLEPLLAGLVRREVLSLQADPRRPERGQYGFLQELLRQVAYDTLSRHDRKARHLAVVAALEQTFEGASEEVPEVLASHLLAAVEAAPEDADAAEIRVRARAALVQAGERAAALAAPEEAQRHLDQAGSLAEDDAPAQAALLERAGVLAVQTGDTGAARTRLERAIELYEQNDDTQAAVRAGVALADVDVSDGRLDEGSRRFEAALAALQKAGPSAELAAVYASLGRLQGLRGNSEPADRMLEEAVRLAELFALDEIFVQALTSRALVLVRRGRAIEGRLLLEGAVALARGRDQPGWWRPANNLSVILTDLDELTRALELNDEIAATGRQRGDRERLATQLGASIAILAALGRWREALARAEEADSLAASAFARSELIETIPILCEQGRLDEIDAPMEGQEWQRTAEQAEVAGAFAAVEARALRARGKLGEARAVALRGFSLRQLISTTSSYVKRCWVEAVEASFALEDFGEVADLLTIVDELHPGERSPSLDAHRARFRARLEAHQGEHARVESGYRRAEILYAGHELVFHHAATQLEHAEWLVSQGRSADAEPLIVDARKVFERLDATPWLEQVSALTRATALA
jgi:class 3 adenylate cyclase/tetratricopeptide (TPR) repeat protein